MIQAVLRALTILGDLGVDASLSPLTPDAPAKRPARRSAEQSMARPPMGRAHTEITEEGERLENHKSIKKEQQKEKND
jgi:hypothetical protein